MRNANRPLGLFNIRYSSPSGFSLLELIVVLVIIGMVAAFVGPKLTGSMGNLNLKTASKEIAASLRYARSQATREGTNYVALFDFGKGKVSIISEEGEAEEVKDRDESEDKGEVNTLKAFNLPDGVHLEKGISGDTETESGLFEIVFFSDGGSSGGDVVLVNERERRYVIRVDFVTGTVRVRRHET